jgi:hypothetical protein
MRVVLCGLVGSAGCTGPSGPHTTLVPADGWVRVEGSVDPFTGEGGADGDCPDTAFGSEEFGGFIVFGVRTDGCSRITVAHPSLAEIPRGAPVGVRIWHDALYADAPAEAVLALAIDGDEVWRGTAPIPSLGAILTGDWTADRTVPAGSTIAWHVHNHGKNAYHLIDLAVWPDADTDSP